MITFNNEIIRKLIHLSSLIVPLHLYYFDKTLTLYILIPIAIAFLLLDFLRINNPKVENIYSFFFNSITRSEEKKSLTGASYVFISSCLIILLFDKEIAIISLLIMTISDTMAALIGRKYGSIRVGKKSIEGTMAFFISSLIILLFFENVILVIGVASIFIATLTELFLKKINDNLTIPFSFALSYMILSTISSFNGVI